MSRFAQRHAHTVVLSALVLGVLCGGVPRLRKALVQGLELAVRETFTQTIRRLLHHAGSAGRE